MGMPKLALQLMPGVEAHLTEAMIVPRLFGPSGINPSESATTGFAGETVAFHQGDLGAGFSEVIADGTTDNAPANYDDPLRG